MISHDSFRKKNFFPSFTLNLLKQFYIECNKKCKLKFLLQWQPVELGFNDEFESLGIVQLLHGCPNIFNQECYLFHIRRLKIIASLYKIITNISKWSLNKVQLNYKSVSDASLPNSILIYRKIWHIHDNKIYMINAIFEIGVFFR